MGKLRVSKIWIAMFLMAILMVGCGDADKNSGAGGPLSLPTVTSVTPPVGSVGACLSTSVTATFSKAMNPATINTSTFTLAGPGNASVPALSVSLDSTGLVATFTPQNALVAGTAYLATITTGVADTFGNHLAAPKTWTFTTGTQTCAAAIAFGQPGCSAGILAGQAITNTGASFISGDVDISPNNASSVTGLTPANYSGTLNAANSTAAAAQAQLTTAYNTAAGLPAGALLPGDIGDLPRVFYPGVYTRSTASGAGGQSLGITGNLTLDPLGDPNAVWVFQIATTLGTATGTTGTGIVNVLSPGQNKNVFWAIGSAANLGPGTTIAGNLMTQSAVNTTAGDTINGRALTPAAGSVTLAGVTMINVPPCQ
jgi:hypothetical protein